MKEHESYEISRNLKKVEQEIRIENLKDEVAQLTGSEMITWKSPKISSDVEEKFLQQVLEYEKAPDTTHFEQLLQAGFNFSPAEEMDDKAMKKKLWELIQKLAQMRVFLHSTDHLSDRELYVKLYTEVLLEETKDLFLDPGSAFHIDLAGSGGEEDIQIYLKYYADKDTRERWQNDFPNDPIPNHEALPYDRDRFLPEAGSCNIQEQLDE